MKPVLTPKEANDLMRDAGDDTSLETFKRGLRQGKYPGGLYIAAEADGIILLAEYDSTLTELNVGIPVVGLCMRNNYNGRISLLDVDAFQAAELAVGYFLRHAKRQPVRHIRD